VQWEAESNKVYFILVSEASTATKNFTLTLATHDSLEGALGPIVPASNTIVTGSIIGADTPLDVPACGSASAPCSVAGVWYLVVGNGQTITASTCGSSVSLDTQISVFLPGNLCVDGNDNFYSTKSQVAWSSVSDQIYFVLVHGKNSSEGSFALQFATQEAAFADADFCANAQPLDVGSLSIVNLSRATGDPDIGCFVSDFLGGNTNIGNFYKFTGTGQPVRIWIDPTAGWDLSCVDFNICGGNVLSVLTGSSCGLLECVERRCNVDCVVTTKLGQDYYVYAFYIQELGAVIGAFRKVT
jgi:hypothetical protein